MSINIYPNSEELSKAAARLFAQQAAEAVGERGKFTVALSGGSSPRRTYELLASEFFKSQIPWQKTYVFWGDERFVSPDDPQNNARMAREVMLKHLPIPSDNIYPIPTNGEPKAAAGQYASTLGSFFDNNVPRFDLIILGLGENGHTASLFPATDVLKEESKTVSTVYLAETKQHRITLTEPVINNARTIFFLVHGHSKAKVLQQVLEGSYQPRQLPAQLIDPADGELFWLIDEEASSAIKK